MVSHSAVIIRKCPYPLLGTQPDDVVLRAAFALGIQIAYKEEHDDSRHSKLANKTLEKAKTYPSVWPAYNALRMKYVKGEYNQAREGDLSDHEDEADYNWANVDQSMDDETAKKNQALPQVSCLRSLNLLPKVICGQSIFRSALVELQGRNSDAGNLLKGMKP